VQRKRSRLWAASVDELASHLAGVRKTMIEAPLDPAVERRAAEVRPAWYEWEMGALDG
jgi:hypothetical protein